MTSSAKKTPVAASALMSVNVRGRLVMDMDAVRSTGAFARQFDAAERLGKALIKAKSQPKK